MEPIKLPMKLVRKNEFSVGGNKGVSFRFQEWEYRHDVTLMLEVSGDPVSDVHRNPLYKIQDLEPGAMVEAEFVPYQDRRQESRDGQRDSVKDVIGLRLSAVRPMSEANPATNGRAEKVGV